MRNNLLIMTQNAILERKYNTLKKIGIVSCYFKHNYGSMLQAYATQLKLDKLGINNETINIEKNIDFKNGKRKYYLREIYNVPFIQSKLGMAKLKTYRKINNELNENISIRNKKYIEFKKCFRLSKPTSTYKELTEMSKEYSGFLVGSDQLWLPVNVVTDYYTLNWVPQDVNKVSFATSFGISKVPRKYKKMYKTFLNRMDSISVRESSGVGIVKEIASKDAKLICDPTMLFSKEEWEEIATKERIIKDKYILCYYLVNDKNHIEFAKKLKEVTGYKTISLLHSDEYIKHSDIFNDTTLYDIGPREWLNLIKNAEYVCTDSFHGTIFSIINNKTFFTFERYHTKNKTISTNSRIYSLLNQFDLMERIYTGKESKEDIENILKQEIDFSKINNKLNILRNDAENFLKNSLKY